MIPRRKYMFNFNNIGKKIKTMARARTFETSRIICRDLFFAYFLYKDFLFYVIILLYKPA